MQTSADECNATAMSRPRGVRAGSGSAHGVTSILGNPELRPQLERIRADPALPRDYDVDVDGPPLLGRTAHRMVPTGLFLLRLRRDDRFHANDLAGCPA